eukprot:scaffold1099_cov194-Alexandrium_tamarense.AAC.6
MSSSPYHEAGWMLNELLPSKTNSGGGPRKSLKSLVNKKGSPNKAAYATVCKTMQHLPAINSILNENNGKLHKAIGIDDVNSKGLLYVMIYELLFGKYKSIRGGGRLKRMIIKHENALRIEADQYAAKNGGVGAGVDEDGANFPRYVRVNTLRSTVAEMVDVLTKDLEDANGAKEGGKSTPTDLKQTIYADAHVPDLLVMHPFTSSLLHQKHEAVKSGKVVLQDKSSCFSALVLARGNSNKPLTSCDVIDACSAPGNKTCHLATLINDSIGATTDERPSKRKKKGKNDAKPMSTIFAFERSSTRFSLLQSRMQLFIPPVGDSNGISTQVAVVPTHADFLKADPNDTQLANVRAILLDPSCSGSGIVNNPDRWMEDSNDTNESEKKRRIQSLANFQLVALKHAMSFPKVDRVVYSTCSINNEENEVVVGKALSETNNSDDNADDGDEWVLVAPDCLEHWPRRGNGGGVGGLSESQAKCLIRCDGLGGDETNGFFVSYFERRKVRASSGGYKMDATTVADSVELPVYCGQFAIAEKEKKKVSPTQISTDDDDSNTKKTKATVSEDVQPQKTAKKTTETKANDKSARKREKKMAWKKQQALKKAQRLKVKEAKGEA